jgi:hypothetical protein
MWKPSELNLPQALYVLVPKVEDGDLTCATIESLLLSGFCCNFLRLHVHTYLLISRERRRFKCFKVSKADFAKQPNIQWMCQVGAKN